MHYVHLATHAAVEHRTLRFGLRTTSMQGMSIMRPAVNKQDRNGRAAVNVGGTEAVWLMGYRQ